MQVVEESDHIMSTDHRLVTLRVRQMPLYKVTGPAGDSGPTGQVPGSHSGGRVVYIPCHFGGVRCDVSDDHRH